MAKKMKRIPFDLEMAKAITKGEKEGRIVVDGYEDTKIVSFNNNGINPIIALLSRNGYDTARGCNAEGVFYIRKASGKFYHELCLEVPDEQEFKEGDVVMYSRVQVAIYKGDMQKVFAWTTLKGEKPHYDDTFSTFPVRLATPEEKQLLIDALKKDNSDKARSISSGSLGLRLSISLLLTKKYLLGILCLSGGMHITATLARYTTNTLPMLYHGKSASPTTSRRSIY